MKKILSKKRCIMLLLILMIVFLCNNNVKAYTNDADIIDENDILESNIEDAYTIIEYDSKTGIKKEIDTNKLREDTRRLDLLTGSNPNCTEPYDPLQNKNHKSQMTPYSDFSLIQNTSEFPYRVTCRLKYDVYGREGIASGFLVGPNILLTAAHCVLNQDDYDKTFADWVAYPGYTNGNPYNGIGSGWSKIYYPSKWPSTHANDLDWCLCILNEDIGSQVGWYGAQAYGTNGEMNGISVKALGYPNIANGVFQYYSLGNIKNTHTRYFDSTAKSTGGMSGGPFARTSDNYAVGIIKGTYKYDENKSYGVRITQQIIDMIKQNRK